jgi:alpha-galactosidase
MELQVSCFSIGSAAWGRIVVARDRSLADETGVARAIRVVARLDADGFPTEEAWQSAPAILFCHDWQGKNADPARETEVRLLWMAEFLFVRFVARYRSITVFHDAEPSGRRDQLWDRDVAEVFLQPNGADARRYKEIEVSPNGQWIDLDIAPNEKRNLHSGLRRHVRTDEKTKTWNAALALPMAGLVERFDPANSWRANFFRVEGASEPRYYSAWRPTKTSIPNFHVPECFGKLIFDA